MEVLQMPAKLSHKFVKAQFELRGYKMLSEYVDTHSKIDFICPNGHQHSISYNSFLRGHRCGICANKKRGEDKRLSHEFVKAQFELEGYQMLSRYISNRTPIKYLCDNQHENTITYNSFKAGHRCGICAKNKKLSHDFVKSQFDLEGYQMLSRYVNKSSKIDFICSNGHRYMMTYGEFNQGNRCGICFTSNFYNTSYYKNKAISRIINSIKVEIKRQDLTVDWRYFYTEDQIKSLAELINNIYNTCPQGYAVDHLVPTSWFNVLKEDELEACWHHENLRHLDAIENNRRKNDMSLEEIKGMTHKQTEIFFTASRNPYK